MKCVFIVGELGISPKTVTHPSSQLQREKCTKNASQPCFNVDVDWNCDQNVQDMTQLGLMDMYGRLGMTEHDMEDDMINTNSELGRGIEREHPESLLPTENYIPDGNHCFCRLTEHIVFDRSISCTNLESQPSMGPAAKDQTLGHFLSNIKDPVTPIRLCAPLLLFWFSRERGFYCSQGFAFYAANFRSRGVRRLV